MTQVSGRVLPQDPPLSIVQISSIVEGVHCKTSDLAASALATNTYVSDINLYHCSLICKGDFFIDVVGIPYSL